MLSDILGVFNNAVILQIISAFLESEWHYLNNLILLNKYFEQPMKMLTAFKPEVLSPHQLNSLFLNRYGHNNAVKIEFFMHS